MALAALLGLAGALVPALPAAADSNWVGVLPGASGVCPPQTDSYWVYQDNEDDNNENSADGWIGGIISDGNTRTTLCRTSSSRFAELTNDWYRVNFAVVALSPNCPVGTVGFDRYFDDEDEGNTSDDYVPSGSATQADGNTTFRFCWYINVDGDNPEAPRYAFPDLGGSYGGWGDPDAGYALQSGRVHTDDEDDAPSNDLSPVDSSLDWYRSMWLEGGDNTTLRTVRIA